MIVSPLAERHYGSARKRFLQSSIERFLDSEFPRTFGPVIRHKLAQHIVALVDQQLPAQDICAPANAFGMPFPFARGPTAPAVGWSPSF